MQIEIEITGTSPLLMHHPRLADPLNPVAKGIKVLTAKNKKTDEDYMQLDRLQWYGGLYSEPNGNGGSTLVIPTRNLRQGIYTAAKQSNHGEAVLRALNPTTAFMPLIYDGPEDIDELFANERYQSRMQANVGQRGSVTLVMRVRPQFFPWAVRMEAMLVPDVGLNFDDLQRIVDLSGVICGLGDGRKIGYGRYTATVREVGNAQIRGNQSGRTVGRASATGSRARRQSGANVLLPRVGRAAQRGDGQTV